MRTRANFPTEREGVNYARSVVERSGCLFKETNLQHDFGHDATIVVVVKGRVQPREIALQIKSGSSFNEKEFCRIPASYDHVQYWAKHDLITLGVVYDPAEEAAYWVDLQSQCLDLMRRTGQAGAVIRFPKAAWNRFDTELFPSVLIPTVLGQAPTISHQVAHNWANSKDFDTHDIGVRTLAVRYKREFATWQTMLNLFEDRAPETLSPEVPIALARIMGHDDIGFYSGEVPEAVRYVAAERILEYGPIQIAKLLLFVDDAGFERPSFGYSLLSVFGARPDSPNMIRAVRDDTQYAILVRNRADLLYRIYESDPEWWSFWRRDNLITEK